jgi:hypothetical protein
MSRSIVVVVGALALFACRSKKDAPPAAGSSSPPLVSASAAPVAKADEPPEPEPPPLPTESDYESEANEQIKGSNLERELDQLEKELIGR